ncbi:MAG: type VI secretion system contractile sheath large subunit [Rhodospirillales bacterium]|nr:type VI secretion system contractile sheath large subunit [Rhodospirillales bacterium]
MATIEIGGIEFGGGAGSRATERVYRICVMGDFGGKATGRLVEVDRDNIDAVMAAMDVTAGGLRFTGLDDFHPDRLLDRMAIGEEPAPEASAQQQEPLPAPTEGLLDTIVAEDAARQTGKSDAERMVERLVAEAAASASPVAPEEAKPGPRAAAALRKLLHDPGFQSVESAWRSLALLAGRLETGSRVRLFMIDLPPAELLAGLQSGRLEKLLIESPAAPWATWVALWRFPAEAGPAALLGRLAKLAAAADATLLAGGDTALAGCRSIAETPDPDDWHTAELSDEAAAAWAALMRIPEAAHLGLVAPRLLLRLPYGTASDPIERFEFEEFPDGPVHERLLWGSGALAAALMLAVSKDDPELDRLPLYVRKDPLGDEAQSPAEAALSIRAANLLHEAGLMSLLWIRDTDRVRLGAWRSLAAGGRLAGRGAAGVSP